MGEIRSSKGKKELAACKTQSLDLRSEEGKKESGKTRKEKGKKELVACKTQSLDLRSEEGKKEYGEISKKKGKKDLVACKTQSLDLRSGEQEKKKKAGIVGFEEKEDAVANKTKSLELRVGNKKSEKKTGKKRDEKRRIEDIIAKKNAQNSGKKEKVTRLRKKNSRSLRGPQTNKTKAVSKKYSRHSSRELRPRRVRKPKEGDGMRNSDFGIYRDRAQTVDYFSSQEQEDSITENLTSGSEILSHSLTEGILQKKSKKGDQTTQDSKPTPRSDSQNPTQNSKAGLEENSNDNDKPQQDTNNTSSDSTTTITKVDFNKMMEEKLSRIEKGESRIGGNSSKISAIFLNKKLSGEGNSRAGFSGVSGAAMLFQELKEKRNDENATKVGKQQQIRREVLVELLKTEKAYIADLTMLIDVFIFPLQIQEIISEKSMKQIFSNIEDLRDINQQFSENLSTKITELCGNVMFRSVKIGKVFQKMGESFKIYSTYCLNHPLAIKTLANLKENNKTFKKFLDVSQTDTKLNGLLLTDYLIKPVQRICKYPLLLRELIKHTDKTHNDYEMLIEASKKIESVCNFINDAQKGAEICDSLQIQTEHLQLEYSPTRKIIKHGKVELRDKHNIFSYEEVMVYLFTDFFIVLKPKDEKYFVPANRKKHCFTLCYCLHVSQLEIIEEEFEEQNKDTELKEKEKDKNQDEKESKENKGTKDTNEETREKEKSQEKKEEKGKKLKEKEEEETQSEKGETEEQEKNPEKEKSEKVTKTEDKDKKEGDSDDDVDLEELELERFLWLQFKQNKFENPKTKTITFSFCTEEEKIDWMKIINKTIEDLPSEEIENFKSFRSKSLEYRSGSRIGRTANKIGRRTPSKVFSGSRIVTETVRKRKKSNLSKKRSLLMANRKVNKQSLKKTHSGNI
eukprot:CAMPEP_0174275514 /NCGR_PEP_ID=MMETSP0439-20130205/59805_1 /TAXON_ID=0 /ORGANISM="Stereomyxa ramosa, Strain Chinc5" /LENGTH=908 /DNA_ID=CAMNT_0015367625 /DNA_START=2226 /DNA_END=4952 /DNA_ORIENTATION=-